MARTTMKYRLENILALLDLQYLQGIDMAFLVEYFDNMAYVYIVDKANGNNKTWFCAGSPKSCVMHLDASREYLRMIYCNIKNARMNASPAAIKLERIIKGEVIADIHGQRNGERGNYLVGDLEGFLDAAGCTEVDYQKERDLYRAELEKQREAMAAKKERGLEALFS